MDQTSHLDITGRYQRAQALINGVGTQNLVQNDTLYPVWIEDTECFWYERFYRSSSGNISREYRLVDANAATNQVAFDHGAFAERLAQATGQAVDQHDLPISRVGIRLAPLRLCFEAFDRHWQFNGEQGCCEELSSDKLAVSDVLSPDGKQIAFIRDYNLWLRDVVSGEERPLTEDGVDDLIYCAGSTAWGTTFRRATTPAAQWSPDGTRLLTVRRDRRTVKTLPMVHHIPSDGSLRPQVSLTKVAHSGDEHVETWQPLIIDVTTGTTCVAEYPPIPAGLSDYFNFFDNVLWWAADSRRAYFIDQERGDRVVRLVEFDTHRGTTRTVFEEASQTRINLIPDLVTLPLHRYLPETNELLWWSERSDWGHLYLYDLVSGELTQTITSGDWCVRDVIHVDSSRREVWIQTAGRTAGRDPYYQDICRVCIETGEITPVLAIDKEVVVHCQNDTNVSLIADMPARARQPVNGVSPSGNFVVTTCSRADQVPTTVLLDRAGNRRLTLETAELSGLPAGWQWPEPFSVKSADKTTDLYGLMFRPSEFSADKTYPVINLVASMPSVSIVPKGSFHNGPGPYSRYYFHGAALAELGFIVLLLDSRGTPLRRKSFQDQSYGWIPSCANNDDHVGALQQLATRYPFLDITRVGIFGQAYHSSLQHFMECQDSYQVCVQMLVMDSRLTAAFEQEGWEGLNGPDPDQCYPEQLAGALQGKLLLMHYMESAMSSAYPPAGAFRLIDALQRANKDFDMLIPANGQPPNDSYLLRRAWDYLVLHLGKVEPPKEFNLGAAS